MDKVIVKVALSHGDIVTGEFSLLQILSAPMSNSECGVILASSTANQVLIWSI